MALPANVHLQQHFCDHRMEYGMNSSQLLLGAILFSAAFGPACETPVRADTASEILGRTFAAQDTLAIGDDPNPDAQECLTRFSWAPETFDVRIDEPIKAGRDDVTIRFNSPLSDETDASAEVVLEWYAVQDEAMQVQKAPAVIVIHESGRNMPVGRMVAAGFRQRGVHAFLLQLPGYGARRTNHSTLNAAKLATIPQGIGDARRAKDAVLALPFLADERVSLQGTSLGGFVASTAAGVDGCFENVFLLLSGGDIYGVLQSGDREAAGILKAAREAGITDDQLKQIAWEVEPTRVAHRVNAEKTWLFSGVLDQVVQIENARVYARAAGLTPSHHVQMPVDHYTGILLLPAILDQMTAEITRP